MKVKLTIYFCVALFPSIFCDGKSIADYVNDVKIVAKYGGYINGIFEPKGDKVMSTAHFNFVFPGTLHPGSSGADIQRSGTKEVAMKFTPSSEKDSAEREYAMYSFLGAIGNEAVEQYGIPTVYYYDEWHQNDAVIMLGISLLDKDISDPMISKELLKHDVNILIIMRNFILSTKYMHSRGVTHNDIDMKNIMVRKHCSFLIDFNLSFKMKNTKNSHVSDAEQRMKDWKRFLYSICYFLGAGFEMGSPDCLKSFDNMKKIKSKTLRPILDAFARHVFGEAVEGRSSSSSIESKGIPDYNYFYNLVNEEIKKSKSPLPIVFTWLKDEQRKEAIADLARHRIPIITEIKDPLNN